MRIPVVALLALTLPHTVTTITTMAASAQEERAAVGAILALDAVQKRFEKVDRRFGLSRLPLPKGARGIGRARWSDQIKGPAFITRERSLPIPAAESLSEEGRRAIAAFDPTLVSATCSGLSFTSTRKLARASPVARATRLPAASGLPCLPSRQASRPHR